MADLEPFGATRIASTYCDKAANAKLLALLIIGAGKNQMKLRDTATCDPVFGAIQDPVVTALVRTGGHFCCGRSGTGFCNADRRFVAREHQFRRQFSLSLRAIGHDCADGTHISLDHDACRDTAGLGDLLDHQHHVEISQTLAAKFGRYGHAHQAVFPEYFDIIKRVGLAAVDIRGTFCKFVFCELACGRLQLPLTFCQFKHFSPLSDSRRTYQEINCQTASAMSMQTPIPA